MAVRTLPERPALLEAEPVQLDGLAVSDLDELAARCVADARAWCDACGEPP
jgi:hypothetical protein